MSYFLHKNAICESSNIGDGTKIWANVHVLPKAIIGRECNICDFVFIENDVVVGDRVTVKSGVQLWDGIRVGNDVFIGPNVTFTNDKWPQSKKHLAEYPTTQVESGASIGANSTILPGITIGEGSMVGAGSVVTKSVPPYSTVYGNPARIQVQIQPDKTNPTGENKSSERKKLSDAAASYSKRPFLDKFIDRRGKLTIMNFEGFDHFDINRIFFVTDVPVGSSRGDHAHKRCFQYLVAVKGTIDVTIDDGHLQKTIQISPDNAGLLVPPMIWSTQTAFSHDAVMAVLASDKFDEEDYIRDYEIFKSLTLRH